MSEYKRKVHTDALETLGKIIGENEKRDAIHLAVVPVVAQEVLKPAQHVSADGRAVKTPMGFGAFEFSAGIVDPFLRDDVMPGERFWLVIYPRKIDSLRHVWTHPLFPEDDKEIETEIEKSKKWIKNYCFVTSFSYDALMEGARKWIELSELFDSFDTDNYDPRLNSRDYSFHQDDLPKEFWFHYEIVTGEKVGKDKKTNFIECCC